MAAITVEITTPGNGKTYEFKTDNQIVTHKFKKIVIEELLDVESNNITLVYDNTIIANVLNGKILDEHKTLHANDVKSGHQMLLL